MRKIALGFVFVSITISCSVTPKKETDKSIKAFLLDFQDKLSKPDEEVLKLFSSDQFKDQILRAIEVLRNKDKTVSLQIHYDEANQYSEDYYVLIDIPVDMIGGNRPSERSFFSLRVVPKSGSFLIIGMEVDRMFPIFFSLKSSIEDSEQLSKLRAELRPYYERARELQKNYDSVIWYVNHDTITYYYVVNGTYNFDSLQKGSFQGYKMGLVDKAGKIIVPLEFDLIGNPSINLPEAVEVSKNGKIGYYSLDGKKIIDINYEWLMPYNEGGASALVKKDSIFGWLDKNFVFHENFPSEEAERRIKGLEYITGKTFTFGNGNQEMITMLYPLTEDFNRPSGLLLVPEYFVNVGLFSRINSGFISATKHDNLYVYGNEFLEAKSEKPFSITESIKAFVSDFKTRYVGGRGEFYNEHKIVLMDRNMNLISSILTSGDYDFQFTRLSDELFESKFRANYNGPNDIVEQNFPEHNYFRFDGNKMIALSSNRRFPFTEFIKLDSSRLKGDFDVYDLKTGAGGKSTFLSKGTLELMRAEILAHYGMIFTNEELVSRFKYGDWYKPTTDSYDEVYSKASEIDKYNLDFLNKLIGSTPGGKSI